MSVSNNLFQLLEQDDDYSHSFSVSPAYYLDRISEEITIEGNKSNYVLRNKVDQSYILISPEEAFIFANLKDNPNIKSVFYKFALVYNKLQFGFISDLIQTWFEKKILLPKNKDLVHYLHHEVTKHKKEKSSYFVKFLQSIIKIKISIPPFSQAINFFYKIFNKIIFNPIFLILGSILTTYGFVGFIASLGHYNLVPEDELISLNSILVIILISLFSILLHEIGHGLALNYSGLKVKDAGFKLYFGIPFFYVDTNDAWSRRRLERIIISGSGILMNAILVAVSFYLLSAINEVSLVSKLVFYLGAINVFNFFINLIPFIEIDGYYILIDAIQAPNLVQKSLSTLRKLIAIKSVRKSDIIYLTFAILYFLTISLFVYLSFSSLVRFFALF